MEVFNEGFTIEGHKDREKEALVHVFLKMPRNTSK